MIVDMKEPTKPTIAGRWWLPRGACGGDERRENRAGRKKRVALHHMIVAGDIGYAAWRDGGFTILNVADPANIKLLAHVNTAPPFAGGTHTPLPLPGRKLAVMLEESNGFACAKGLSYTWLYDVRVLENPVSISTLPTPTDQSWCRPGENFGPHNLHENRPESFHERGHPVRHLSQCRVANFSTFVTPSRRRKSAAAARAAARQNPGPAARQRACTAVLRHQCPAQRHHVHE